MNNAAIMGEYTETRDACLVPYRVTFASLNKVKFYLDFDKGVHSDKVAYLEKEAQLTISKLKNCWLFRKGIIENVISDINKSEQIIYFDIMLGSRTTKTSFLELLGYLNNYVEPE